MDVKFKSRHTTNRFLNMDSCHLQNNVTRECIGWKCSYSTLLVALSVSGGRLRSSRERRVDMVLGSEVVTRRLVRSIKRNSTMSPWSIFAFHDPITDFDGEYRPSCSGKRSRQCCSPSSTAQADQARSGQHILQTADHAVSKHCRVAVWSGTLQRDAWTSDVAW